MSGIRQKTKIYRNHKFDEMDATTKRKLLRKNYPYFQPIIS